MVRAAAAAYGDAIAIALDGETIASESASFAELNRDSAELARGLIANGVGKGTRLGFIFGNGPGFALMLAAIARIGAIAVPISTMIRANELIRVLKQSDISGLIVQRRFLNTDYVERLCEAMPELHDCGPELRIAKAPFLRWIASTGDRLPNSMRSLVSFTHAAASVSEELLRAVEAEVHETDQMIEIYTSGSMALPKGVRHLHGPVLFRAGYVRDMTGLGPSEETAARMPMFWVGGLMMTLLPAWIAGAKTTCTERTMNNSRIAMGSVLADEDLKLMGQSKPYWGLGMSETLGPYSYGDELRAPGYPMCAPMDHWADRYDVRVAGESDQPVPDGKIGEVQVRGYAVTPGLHKLERLDYFTADGYFRTGDMALIEGSRVNFIGRSGDMIKTAGSNVAPAEVEMEMQALDGVRHAYVVGLPDQKRGQQLVAAVVPREGARLDFTEIEAKLRNQLSSYKVPRAYVEITVEDVPMLHSNKISRRKLEALVSKKLQAS
ncbi:class I adenylate-forming enzyme family protein [Novosphingobium sp. M1R2S20]|uniref:Class I adenylate-forming enzyme family protein n=1 Tax=Novosphingobium rhizovicinum TaxID=3228928 RepID=A0ABV3RD79_9SPHN